MSKGRSVLILGVQSLPEEKMQSFWALPQMADMEVSVVNEAHRNLPEGRQASRVFQMHPRDWREAERRYLNHGALPFNVDPDCFGRNKEHIEYLQKCGVSVYGQQVWPDIPTSVCYPFELVTEQVGIHLPPHGEQRLWATSSFAYMIALLITEHLLGEKVRELRLFSVELPLGTWRERTWEWPCFAYYLGLAKGLGIDVLLPLDGSSLLSAPHYALEGRPLPGDPDHWFAPSPATIIEDDGVYRLGAYEV